MGGEQSISPVIFVFGLMLLAVTLTFARDVFPDGSWWPTLMFVPTLVCLLVGQLWFLGAVSDASRFEALAIFMFLLVCALPLAGAAASTRATPYRLIFWTTSVLLVLETVVFLAAAVNTGAASAGASAAIRPKPKLPG